MDLFERRGELEGPAGIGRSRLLAEARSRAKGSMRVLSARGASWRAPARAVRRYAGSTP